MIEIQNEELYYSLPKTGTTPNNHHTPPNMALKTIIYLPDKFYASQVRLKIKELWGVDMSISKVSRAIRVLYDANLLSRTRPDNYDYFYEKTILFHRLVGGESKDI